MHYDFLLQFAKNESHKTNFKNFKLHAIDEIQGVNTDYKIIIQIKNVDLDEKNIF